MDQGNPVIKTVIVSGFLGAGKTTLINRLIDWYSERANRLAVMINEFGSIGIDGALVKAGDFHKIELNKGSIFCVCMRTDFISEIKKIAEEIQPDYLLIEATGIARVDDMYAMMRLDGLDKLISIQQNICVVDAANFHKVEATVEAVQIQAEYADIFVLNKIDTVPRERLEETESLLREHNGSAPIFPAQFGKVSWEKLANLTPAQKEIPAACSDLPPDNFFSFSLELQKPLDRGKWEQFIEEIRAGVLRGKGIVWFPAGPRYFEIIAGEYMEKPSPPSLIRENTSKIVFIRSGVGEESLAKRLKACTIQGDG